MRVSGQRTAATTACLLALAVEFGLSLHLQLRLLPNHDVAWILEATRQMLSGRRLYADILETNPPLIVLLSAPAVAVADALALPLVRVFHVFVYGLIGLALDLTAALLPATWIGRERLGVGAHSRARRLGIAGRTRGATSASAPVVALRQERSEGIGFRIVYRCYRWGSRP